MAILQVRSIDDRLYASLKSLADREHRSVSQEVIHILEEKLTGPISRNKSQIEALKKFGETFPDAEEMIKVIRSSRRNSWRFSPNRVFD